MKYLPLNTNNFYYNATLIKALENIGINNRKDSFKGSLVKAGIMTIQQNLIDSGINVSRREIKKIYWLSKTLKKRTYRLKLSKNTLFILKEIRNTISNSNITICLNNSIQTSEDREINCKHVIFKDQYSFIRLNPTYISESIDEFNNSDKLLFTEMILNISNWEDKCPCKEKRQ